MLATSFPNLTSMQVEAVVGGMFDLRKDYGSFKNHLRDFLVQSKEFATADNAELYAEEIAAARENEKQRLSTISGMVKSDQIGMDDMS